VCGEHIRYVLANQRHRGSSPRVWGTCVILPALAIKIGSSPRVWGTYDRGGKFIGIDRFIPTCVGNIELIGFDEKEISVHPHVCGEHPMDFSMEVYSDRFIPTCVGNIQGRSDKAPFHTVHPHVCGEHLVAIFMVVPIPRFIPTCVGNIQDN